MSRATLIVNPRAGSRRDLATLIPAMIRVLEAQGIVAGFVETTGPNTAASLAANALSEGADTVVACGGDGTVHEVLQGVVGTSAALGVVPIGTANALARNLGLSPDPRRAISQLAGASIARIPVGRVEYSASNDGSELQSRCFAVLAGAGPDGALVYSLLAGKAALGRTAYYAHAARLFMTRPFPPFRISYRSTGSDSWQEDRAVNAMCARVGDLGGLFSKLTHGSSLYSTSLRLSYLRPPGRLSLPSWFVSGQLGIHSRNPWLRTIEVDEFRCEPIGEAANVHAQVDGEWIGRLPISVRLIPDALSFLIPTSVPSR
ncbi:diacylglycerol kinase family enzyme [Granulicella aggregans]|uniref:Diacylglycerol kinase family enzyme n=1 Tax=Granulicella aggregans TaxID=474949 RepID=A0A7W7ZDR1_9BACT|nr:diacylglycerol kinase family protein [Granulicella aggregans]MBB5057983.1 diacylglycerol kinase family enzyme [Granulicella aggregans]